MVRAVEAPLKGELSLKATEGFGSAVPTAICCRAFYRRLSAAINQSGRSLRIRRLPCGLTAGAALLVHPACPAKAPFGASVTHRPRQNIPANLVVQLELPRLLLTTKSWPDRNVSSSEPNHGTALERVRPGSARFHLLPPRPRSAGIRRASQAPLVPLAAAAALHFLYCTSPGASCKA